MISLNFFYRKINHGEGYNLSCYIRHMKEFLTDLGFETETKEERKEIDLAIREVIGKKSSDQCNDVWRELKIWLSDDDKKMKLASILKP